MKKFYILALMAAFLALPAHSMEQADDAIEDEMQSVSIVVKEGNVKVNNAVGQKLEIFNNLSRGCYILKVGKTVRKVNMK